MYKKMKMNIRNIFLKDKRTKIIIFTIIILFGRNIFAQDDFSQGSPYTAFGIGDLQYTGNIRTASMGILGISLFGNNANDINPAGNTKLGFTDISLGFKYTFLNSSNSVTSSKNSNGNVSGVDIGIPLNKDLGWSMNLGFIPISTVNYKISNQVVTPEGVPYTQTYAGGGGVSRINFGMSYTLFKSINLGAEYNYSFGNIKKLVLLDFGNSDITNSYERSENNLSGSYFKGGIILEAGKLINSKLLNDLNFGFFYQSKLNLTSNIDAIYQTILGNDTSQITGGTLVIPSSYGFGFSNKFGKQLIVSGDALIQDWSNYISAGQTQANFGNSYRMGLGFEIIPIDKPDNTFWENLSYRFGGFYQKSYFTVNGTDIIGYGITAGLGIPLNKFNSLDLGISYSVRGKTDNGLIKDQLIKLSAGFNFGELWFIKARTED
jgi:hypothetical protein